MSSESNMTHLRGFQRRNRVQKDVVEYVPVKQRFHEQPPASRGILIQRFDMPSNQLHNKTMRYR